MKKLSDGTRVKHKSGAYQGAIVGVTWLKQCFTGNKDCEFQYRIELRDRSIKIAPFQDLEVISRFDYVRSHQTGPQSEVYPARAQTKYSNTSAEPYRGNRKIPSLYHFTDPKNLPSIKQFGLLSWEELLRKKIIHNPASGGPSRSLDSHKGLSNYVRLCLRQDHPMVYIALREGRIKDIRWLKIDPGIVRRRPTLFSDINATANNARIDSDPATALDSDDSQAEVLVEGVIHPTWISFPTTFEVSSWLKDLFFSR